MANNIKIVGDILNTTLVSRYTEEDKNLLSSKEQQENFGGEKDYIEYYIYDISGNLLNTEYNYLSYKLPPSVGLIPSVSNQLNTTDNIQTTDVGITSTLSQPTSSLYPIIEIDPVKDLQDLGYSSGEFRVRYNFFQNKISNNSDSALFIKEISQDRTELRLASLTLTNEEIENLAISLINEMNNSTEYYVDYLLNFGSNTQVVAVNIALNRVPEGYEILFKLYNPLPLDIITKTQLWVVDEKVNPYEFDINLDKLIIPPPPPQLKGPNFDIKIDNIGTISTPYTNYQTLIARLETLQRSSYQQILGLLASQSADINIDYTDYNNFSFFGSAEQRLINFYDKAKQIENYKNQIDTYSPLTASTPSLITEINQYSSSINNIITKFDGYENYLYFESSSYAWPKSGSLKPFELLSTGSTTVINWYNSFSFTAATYDRNNNNNLIYLIPSYLIDDTNNQPFLTFLNMVGHYFDNIWMYLKSITDLNIANNNLEAGISKDLVYYQLQSLGLKLYNSQAGEALDQFLIGANTGSSTWDNNFTVTGSYLNNIPRKDLVSELYKRIYHNLPLLLKQKGTVEGLDNLMTIFGIPNRTYYTIYSGSIPETFYTLTGSAPTSSILDVKEYGGGLKSSLINGYNNDKVRIVSNSITGNVLSPILSLQTFSTASNEFRENDMHYVDISFSPQSQINTYISGAIASNNSTWRIDDYIGDPRYIYSSSYELLEAERTKYYQVGVSGYAPFTASALDYNGFIRLIEYFDNALFKMLSDFVPERASLSTGVTFESPVLERNKAVYANPTTTTTQSVYEANYPSSDISSDYGTFYDYLTGSKEAWYNGEISGSYIDVYDYFENSNPNPYVLANTSSFTTQYINEFNHSDFNVLFNNVSQSITSLIRKGVEYIPGSTSSILYTPELQDSYLNLTSYNSSRYNGSKTYSLKYNIHTPSPSSSYSIKNKILSASLDFSNPNYSWLNTTTQRPFFPPGFSDNNTYPTITINPIENIPGKALELYNILLPFYINKTPLYIATSELTNKISNLNKRFFEIANITLIKYPSWGTSNNNDATGVAIALKFLEGNTLNYYNLFSTNPRSILIYEAQKSYAGDYSFGKTAAIDRQSYKVGWVKNIPSQSLNFFEKTQIQLKYLVDSNNTITDLNLKNNNLFEVQNTFKSGDNVVLSLADAIKPSFQKPLDGTKLIFRGGFSFDPILYREKGETMSFRYLEPTKTIGLYQGFRARHIESYRYELNAAEAFLQNPLKSNPDRVPSPIASSNINDGGYRWRIDGYQDSTPIEWQTEPMADGMWVLGSTNAAWKYQLNTSAPDAIKAIYHPDYPNTFLSSYNYSATDEEKVYVFSLINFNTRTGEGTYNTFDKQVSNIGNKNYIFQAPASSTYTIKGVIPIIWNTQAFGFTPGDYYPYLPSSKKYGYTIKLFAIIERGFDPDSSTEADWTYVASTRIKEYALSNGILSADWDLNSISIDTSNRNWNGGIFGCSIVDDNTGALETDVILQAGEYLRIRFFIMDSNQYLRTGKYVDFQIGKPQEPKGLEALAIARFFGLETTWERIPDPYIEIIDKANPIVQYETLVSVTDIKAFSVYKNHMYFISGDNDLYELVNSPAIFEPSPDSSTSQYYSQIIDTFTVQPGDLIRIGQFNNPKPDYYTVLNAEYKDGISLLEKAQVSFVREYVWNIQYQLLSAMPYYTSILVLANNAANREFFDAIYRSATRQFSISTINTTIANEGTYTMYAPYRVYQENPDEFFSSNQSFLLIAVAPISKTVPNPTIAEDSPGGYTTVTVLKEDPFGGIYQTTYTYDDFELVDAANFDTTDPSVKPSFDITVDKDFSSSTINLSSNFAILRPKPDETSVIVEYRKRDGDVSQTILVPSDANDKIKAKAGKIFKDLNVDLSNTNNTQGLI